MYTSPKNAIQMIANGSDYYFIFKTIDVIRNGQLIKKPTDDNCEYSRLKLDFSTPVVEFFNFIA